MKHWWCMECDREVGLGKHGQCEGCGSEAVYLLQADAELTHADSGSQQQAESAPVGA